MIGVKIFMQILEALLMLDVVLTVASHFILNAGAFHLLEHMYYYLLAGVKAEMMVALKGASKVVRSAAS